MHICNKPILHRTAHKLFHSMLSKALAVSINRTALPQVPTKLIWIFKKEPPQIYGSGFVWHQGQLILMNYLCNDIPSLLARTKANKLMHVGSSDIGRYEAGKGGSFPGRFLTSTTSINSCGINILFIFFKNSLESQSVPGAF